MDNHAENTLDSQLPVIDWELATRLVGGKKELAEEMFKLFMDDLPNSYARIKNAFDTQDLVKLKNEMHRFLGGCSYCGLPRLRAISLEFESKLKQAKTTSEEINTLFERFNEEVDSLKSAVAE